MTNLLSFALFVLIVVVASRLFKRYGHKQVTDLESSADAAINAAKQVARRRTAAVSIPPVPEPVGRDQDKTPVLQLVPRRKPATTYSVQRPAKKST